MAEAMDLTELTSSKKTGLVQLAVALGMPTWRVAHVSNRRKAVIVDAIAEHIAEMKQHIADLEAAAAVAVAAAAAHFVVIDDEHDVEPITVEFKYNDTPTSIGMQLQPQSTISAVIAAGATEVGGGVFERLVITYTRGNGEVNNGEVNNDEGGNDESSNDDTEPALRVVDWCVGWCVCLRAFRAFVFLVSASPLWGQAYPPFGVRAVLALDVAR